MHGLLLEQSTEGSFQVLKGWTGDRRAVWILNIMALQWQERFESSCRDYNVQ